MCAPHCTVPAHLQAAVVPGVQVLALLYTTRLTPHLHACVALHPSRAQWDQWKKNKCQPNYRQVRRCPPTWPFTPCMSLHPRVACGASSSDATYASVTRLIYSLVSTTSYASTPCTLSLTNCTCGRLPSSFSCTGCLQKCTIILVH